MKLAAYLSQYATAVADKPADASIGVQQASVSEDGNVIIHFVSSDELEIVALRDWLNTLITEE